MTIQGLRSLVLATFGCIAFWSLMTWLALR